MFKRGQCFNSTKMDLLLDPGLEKKQRTLPQTDSFTDIRLSLASGLASYVSGHDASYHKIDCRLQTL